MYRRILLSSIFILLLSVSLFPQKPYQRTDRYVFGLEGGLLALDQRDKIIINPYYFRASAELSGLNGGMEIGLGYYNTFDHKHYLRYSSDLITMDFRLKVNSRSESSKRYFYPYIGVGIAYNEHRTPESSELFGPGTAFAIEMLLMCGLGLEFPMNEEISLAFIGGVTWLSSKFETGELKFVDKRHYTLGTRVTLGKNGFIKDSDQDGIRDAEEIEIYRTNPENKDTDGDGLSDYDEIFKYKTDPLKADTDSDGIPDGQEIDKYRTDPLKSDTDGDGISDGDEILIYKTDTRNRDTDGDGLSDYDEIFVHKSDPLKADTDGDGISDQVEVVVYKTSPILADTDGDGLSDHDEVMKHKTSPFKSDTDGDGINDFQEITVYITDPFKADTDGDSLNDYDEITVYKTNPLKNDTDIDRIFDGIEVYTYKTNPLSEDSDNDGLGDYQEVFEYSTNPLSTDTDSSGVDDKTEIERGTDPVDIEDDVIEVDKVIVLEGIEFEFKKADITPESERRLQKTLKLLYAFPDYAFSLEGHTDDIGSKQFNKKLSFDRANAVKKWLVDRGINPKRLTVKGYGFDRPIASNETEEGRQRNRRVEFIRTN